MEMGRQLLLALDPVSFARDILDFEPDPWQVEALRSTERRLLLNCARQSGKSSIAAIVALHTAYFSPGKTLLIVSPTLLQARELYRKVASFRGKLEGSHALLEDTKFGFEFENHSRVMCVTADERYGRGFTADLIIIDEASRIEDDDAYYALRPTLVRSGGRMILSSTPYGKRGFFWREWVHGGSDWKRIKVTVDDCPRASQSVLEEDHGAMPSWWFRQEYYCEFLQKQASVFGHDDMMGLISSQISPLPDDLRDWKPTTERGGPSRQFIIGLDLGKEADHSGLVILEQMKNRPELHVVFIRQFSLHTQYLEIVEATTEYTRALEHLGCSKLVVDAGGVGQAIVELFHQARLRPIQIVITGGARTTKKSMYEWNVPKEGLIGQLQIIVEGHQLLIPEELPYRDLFVDEFLNFEYRVSSHANILFGQPNGTHDDLVLATAMASWYATNNPYRDYRFLCLDLPGPTFPGFRGPPF